MINWDLVTDKKSFIEQAKDVLPTIEIDSLTNYGASLLNRDRGGFAKKIVFGGVERGRISSQAKKYAIRQAKYDRDTWYTKSFDSLVADAMKRKVPDISNDYIDHAKALTLKLLIAKNTEKNGHMFKVSVMDAESVATAIIRNIDPGKPVQEDDWKFIVKKESEKSKVDASRETAAIMAELSEDAKTRGNSSEVAMFGRMSTSSILKSVDGAVAMSHAFTTHEYNGDIDFTTAVDELKEFGFNQESEEEAGAGGLWDIDLNAGCFYQYCSISTMIYALNMLDGVDFNDKQALKERVSVMAKEVSEFIRLYLLTAPVAMQNSKASFPGPSAVYIRAAIRPQNHSYENAFARPVISNGEMDVVELSARRLVKCINRDIFFDNLYDKRYWLSDNDYPAPEGTQADKRLKDVLVELEEYIDGACH